MPCPSTIQGCLGDTYILYALVTFDDALISQVKPAFENDIIEHDGIQFGFGTFSNIVHRNFIGTDPSGGSYPNALLGLGNGRYGVRISDATDNLIGGETDAAGNRIAGNLSHGVAILPGGLDLPTVRNQVVGNSIGILVGGVTPLGNGRFRVDGLLFHMPGSWEIYVSVAADGAKDRATFPVWLQ